MLAYLHGLLTTYLLNTHYISSGKEGGDVTGLACPFVSLSVCLLSA